MTPGILSIEVWDDTVIRVRYAPGNKLPPDKSLIVVGPPRSAVRWKAEETSSAVTIVTAKVRASVSLANGAVTFADAAGKTVLRETTKGGRVMTPFDGYGEKAAFHALQRFALAPGEAIYGLGQHQDGLMNYRGRKITLSPSNMVAVVPVLVSSRGYGILWDNCSLTWQEDGTWWSDVADAIDYYFLYGPSLDEAIAGYRRLSGAAPLFGKWAYGFWQCKERYKTQEELLEVVREYRRRNVPLDNIVQDWFYWTPYPLGSHQFDPERFPDPAGMIQECHEKHHVHVMISVWSQYKPGSENYRRLHQAGFLYPPYELDSYYDVFNPKAREMVWHQIKNALFTKGVDAWWLDGTEPELAGWNWDPDLFKRFLKPAIGTGARYLNAYSLMATEGVYQGQRATTSDKRVFILTRSAYAGQQRNAAVTWSGDITASWKVFRRQISAGLNFCLSGVPYWTTDIGAFFVKDDFPGGCKNREYRELFVRWFQYGAFCPIFRVHGTSTPREMWHFGGPGSVAYRTLVQFDRLRYRLLPYIYSLAWNIAQRHGTLMRALVMDFPDDRQVLSLDDEFMFGPAMLVAPVTRYRARRRSVYLPQGAAWFDFWTGRRFSGGRAVAAAAPIERMPLFVRAGAIVPMGPVVQYAAEKPADPLELRIYAGADGQFTLYEDEGDNYNYEKGVYATIPLKWDDARQTLIIGPRQGEFPGMLRTRTFRIVLVKSGHGAGPSASGRADETVRFTGTQIEISLD